MLPKEKRRKNKTRFRNAIFATIGLFLGLLLALFLLEAFFRIREAVTHNSLRAQLLRYNNCFEKDPYLYFRLKAGYSGICLTDEFQYETQINALAMRDYRDQEHEHPQESSKYVILALGDSFAFGTGVNLQDSFLSIVEKKLSNVLVLKAGVPGYNIYQYLEYLKYYGLKYKPDLVLVNICVLNDLGTEMEKADVTEDGYLGARYKNEYRTSLLMRLNRIAFNNSALFRFLRSRGIDFHSLAFIFKFFGDKEVLYDTPHLSELLHIENNKTQKINQLYACFLQVMSSLKTLAAQNNAKLVVNLIPFRVQIEKDTFLRQIQSLPVKYSEFDTLLIQRRMTAILNELNIACLDPADRFIFAYQTSKTKLFWNIDGHLSREGNRLMAEALAGYLGKVISFAPIR